MKIAFLRTLAMILSAIIASSIWASLTWADAETSRITVAGSSKEQLYDRLYNEAIRTTLTERYGFQPDNSVISRLTASSMTAKQELFLGTPVGPIGQRGSEWKAQVVLKINEAAFEGRIKGEVEQYLRATGSKNILTAFVVTSSKNIILDAEAAWLKGRGEYNAALAIQRANERLSKSGDDIDRKSQATMARFGIPFRPTPGEFRDTILKANADIANSAAGSAYAELEAGLLAAKGDFNRALIAVVDIDRLEAKDSLFFVSATVGGRLYNEISSDRPKYTPVQLIARGVGTDLDSAVGNLLEAAARSLIVGQLVAAILSTTADQNVYTVRMCGDANLRDLRVLKDVLRDMGRVVAVDNTIYKIYEPKTGQFDEFVFELDEKMSQAKKKIKYDLGTKTVSIGPC